MPSKFSMSYHSIYNLHLNLFRIPEKVIKKLWQDEDDMDKYKTAVGLYRKLDAVSALSSFLRPIVDLYLQKPLNRLSANWASIRLEPQNLRTSTTQTLQ